METADHLAALRRDGDLMAGAIAAVAPDAPIPTCPEWTMRDLVHHTGQVHRWANVNVAHPSAQPADPEAARGPLPADGELVDWFREGHGLLVATLEQAPPDVECWSFMAAPSPLAFWARRQCHETGMHRADAESASGPISTFPADQAVDGIDELLSSFITRGGGRLSSELSRTLRVHATDTGDEWFLRVTDRVETSRESDDADGTLAGAASDLHLFLWNRAGLDALDVQGDASLVDGWRDTVAIRWGR